MGFEGCIIGMNSFGEFVLVGELFKFFGFIVENVVIKVKEIL